MFNDSRIPQENRSVLGQSWRVPRAVHKAAAAWIGETTDRYPFDYKPRDEDGEVQSYRTHNHAQCNWQNPRSLIPFIEHELLDGRSVMIQTTCAYQIVPSIAALREAALPYANPWRQRRGDWNPLGSGGVSMAKRLHSLVAPLGEDRYWTWMEMCTWLAAMRATSLGSGVKTMAKKYLKAHGATADAVDESEEFLSAEVSPTQPGTAVTAEDLNKAIAPGVRANFFAAMEDGIDGIAQWYVQNIETAKMNAGKYPLAVLSRRGPEALALDPKKSPCVYVGTMHSFKGAEADTCIVFPDLSPLGAKNFVTQGGPRNSVIRLGYVAMTRSRHRLVLCEPARRDQSMPLALYA